MHPTLTPEELLALVERVFRPRPEDRALAILVDLPDAARPDHPRWLQRRRLAAQWAEALEAARARSGIAVTLALYRNVRANNAELPERCWVHLGGELPPDADALPEADAVELQGLLRTHRLVLAPTELSTTAPLKLLAKSLGFRAATMPGFSEEMVPALRLDYTEINRRVNRLKELLDRATGARFRFRTDRAREHALFLDLRFRTAHASGGLLPEPGQAGNLPSGEAYTVPYEGERPGVPSLSAGELPVQLGSELVVYRIENNRAAAVTGEGQAAREEAERLVAEPAYANLAELGLGVLGDFGVEPCGEILLDEKLGLHIAFGRSDHFGGQVGPKQFSRPEAVVHIDRVYLPSLQPRVEVLDVDLEMPDEAPIALMREGRYAIEL